MLGLDSGMHPVSALVTHMKVISTALLCFELLRSYWDRRSVNSMCCHELNSNQSPQK